MDTVSLWQNAVPLESAFLRFAPRDTAARYRQLVADTSASAIADRMQTRAEAAGADLPEGMFERLHLLTRDAWGPTGERTKMEQALKAACLALIRAGTVRAFGFAVPRQPHDVPVELPADLWNGIILWERSRVEAHGLRIEGVRLIPTARIEALQTQQAPREPARRPGRRSRESQIIEAFKALAAAGRIDTVRPLARVFPMIRTWVCETYPDDPDGEKGLNDKTLRKVLTPLFGARRKCSKL